MGGVQVVLRGCQVKNTASLRGLVLFTGHECKIMMGAHGPASKRSRLERRLDLLILAMFGLLGAMCLVNALGAALWTSQVRCSAACWQVTTEGPKGYQVCCQGGGGFGGH